MYNLPDKYLVNKRIPLKDLIPKEIALKDKKKLKEYLKSITLTYQIMGEDIPSVINEEYNYQVIQFFDFEITDIKKASFIAMLYQEIIKSPCVIRLFDTTQQAFSLALKRLNKNDATNIVVTDSLLTKNFPLQTAFSQQSLYTHNTIKNTTNKRSYYLEVYGILYIQENEKLYSSITCFFDSPIWYDEEKVLTLCDTLKELSSYKVKLRTVLSNTEKIAINKEIRRLIGKLDAM